MHEKHTSPSNDIPKGHHLPHFPDLQLGSAMMHPAYGELQRGELDLENVLPLGERAASDPEVIRLIQAFNAAPGQLIDTPNGELLEAVHSGREQAEDICLASIGARDERSNGIVYLRRDKFISAVGLRNYITGREVTKNGKASRVVIEAYSQKPSTTMPPLLHVVAYYEEEGGRTYYSLVGDGAHRLAASHRRGDEYVPVSSVSFHSIDGHPISDQIEELPLRKEQLRSQGRSVLRLLGIGRRRE